MHYVYLLKSEINEKFYLGSTANVDGRVLSHNAGKNKATSLGRPWTLVYYEAYGSKTAALVRERRLKHHGKGLSELKKRLNA